MINTTSTQLKGQLSLAKIFDIRTKEYWELYWDKGGADSD